MTDSFHVKRGGGVIGKANEITRALIAAFPGSKGDVEGLAIFQEGNHVAWVTYHPGRACSEAIDPESESEFESLSISGRGYGDVEYFLKKEFGIEEYLGEGEVKDGLAGDIEPKEISVSLEDISRLQDLGDFEKKENGLICESSKVLPGVFIHIDHAEVTPDEILGIKEALLSRQRFEDEGVREAVIEECREYLRSRPTRVDFIGLDYQGFESYDDGPPIQEFQYHYRATTQHKGEDIEGVFFAHISGDEIDFMGADYDHLPTLS